MPSKPPGAGDAVLRGSVLGELPKFVEVGEFLGNSVPGGGKAPVVGSGELKLAGITPVGVPPSVPTLLGDEPVNMLLLFMPPVFMPPVFMPPVFMPPMVDPPGADMPTGNWAGLLPSNGDCDALIG